MAEDKFAYILYLIQNHDLEQPIFLGTGEDPVKLFTNGLNYERFDINKRSLIMKWLFLVEANLSDSEKKDLEYAFMKNPLNEFEYSIKDMTLYIKRINQY